jgi:hypothetical protein
MSSHPVFLQVLSASVKAADRAGQLVRDIMKSADLVHTYQPFNGLFAQSTRYVVFMCVWGGGAETPCASPPPWPSIFSVCSFWVYHLANRDDLNLLARAIVSDFSVAVRQICSEFCVVAHFRFHSTNKAK